MAEWSRHLAEGPEMRVQAWVQPAVKSHLQLATSVWTPSHLGWKVGDGEVSTKIPASREPPRPPTHRDISNLGVNVSFAVQHFSGNLVNSA